MLATGKPPGAEIGRWLPMLFCAQGQGREGHSHNTQAEGCSAGIGSLLSA